MTTTPTVAARRWHVVLVMTAVVVIWGAAFSGIKILLEDISPGALTVSRLVIAAMTYTVLLPMAGGSWPAGVRNDLWRLVLVGVTSGAGYHLAINWGEQFVSAGLASLIVAAMPAMVAVLAAVVLKEVLGPQRAAGVGIAFGGVVVLVVLGTGEVLEAESTLGVIVTLIAPLSWAVYTIVSKPLSARYDGVRLNLIGGWVGALVVLPVAFTRLGELGGLDAEGWAWLLFLGVFSSAGSYVAYIWALRSWSTSAVATFVYLVPPASLLWAWLLLDEVPSLWAIAGGVLILGGVVMVQRAR